MSIKEATANAIEFARAALGPERTNGVRLEEVESTNVGGRDVWLITLSMISPEEQLDPIAAAFGHARREYKTFTVLKDNGEIRSMKIRELANV